MTASHPRLILLRQRFVEGQPTLGSFLWEGPPNIMRHLGIRCIELPWFDNRPKVSCVAPGLYPMTYVHSAKYKRKLWRLTDVPQRAGILIHPGNYAGVNLTHSLGCPLPCLEWADLNGDGVIDGKRSKEAMDLLGAQLEPYEETGILIDVRNFSEWPKR